MATTTNKTSVPKNISSLRRLSRRKRHARLRKKISGTDTCPRLVVKRSTRHVHVQIIDDTAGHTLVNASTSEKSIANAELTKTEMSKTLGRILAQRAQDAGITRVVFDRGGNKFHGRIAALADAARESGLQF